jgi:GNAT superfamily N-acetyltransferase
MTAVAEKQLATDLVLRDGSTAHVQPVEPEDAEALREFLISLSLESRWLRFFSGGSNIDDYAHWAADVQERDGLGLIVTIGDPPEIIAHGEYERIDARRAEVAFAVADAFRGHGVATLLMEHLAESARTAGIEMFVADVLPQNAGMLEVFHESGFSTHFKRSSDGVSVEVSTEFTPSARKRYSARERIAESAKER